jgi:hypothetical protein
MVKRGAARAVLTALSLAVLAALAAAWLWTRSPAAGGVAGPLAATDPTSPAGPASATARVAAADADPVGRRDAPTDPKTQAADDPDRFRGRGRIRGELRAQGVDVPRRWTLVLEPHPTLVGSEHATARRVEFENGETRFDVEDLPLGGYRVRAEAAALNSTSAPVPLVRGASDVFVTLYLAQAGLVDGFVFDHAGHAAEGFPVTLESTRDKSRTCVEVDGAGAFVARGVVDGEYRIFFGEPDAPLVEPETFAFRAPTLRWPATNLPPTGSARITVRDAHGAPVFEAKIVGSGSPHGVVRGLTASDGTWVARYLLPGRYHVNATLADGRSTHGEFAARADARAEVELRLE